MPGARPVAVFGVAFLPDFLGRRHRKLVASSCAAAGHSATQREEQHAVVGASSAKVVSTLGAARTSCSSSRRRSAMRGTVGADRRASPPHLQPLALRERAAALGSFEKAQTGADSVPSALGAARMSCSTPRHGVFSATRCSRRWQREQPSPALRNSVSLAAALSSLLQRVPEGRFGSRPRQRQRGSLSAPLQGLGADEKQHSAPCGPTGADTVPLALGAARISCSTPRLCGAGRG